MKFINNHSQLITNITSYKEGIETEMDNIRKATKQIMKGEFRNSRSGLLEETGFMVEQLQAKFQKEFKSYNTDTKYS